MRRILRYPKALLVAAYLCAGPPPEASAQATLVDSFPNPPPLLWPTGITYDGTHYWISSYLGKIAKLDSDYQVIHVANGVDYWPSVTYNPTDGNVYLKSSNSNALYRLDQDPFDGSAVEVLYNWFQAVHTKVTISPVSGIAYDQLNGRVRAYDLPSGDTLAEFQLDLQHSLKDPGDRALAHTGQSILTYSGEAVYAYDTLTGGFLGRCELPGAGLNGTSMSYADGRFYLRNTSGSMWYSYELEFDIPRARCFVLAACPELTYEGGGVAIQVKSQIGMGILSSLELVSMRKDGIETQPLNPPTIVGLGGATLPAAPSIMFFWKSAQGESGTWQICFRVENDLGDTDTCCHTVDVLTSSGAQAEWGSKLVRFREGEPVAMTWPLRYTTTYASTAGIEGWFQFSAISGNPLFTHPIEDSDIVVPGSFLPPVFESIAFNTISDGVTTDSLIMGFVNFNATGLPQGTYEVGVKVSLAPSEGIILAEDIMPLPCCINGYCDMLGNCDFYSIAPGCLAVTTAPYCAVSLAGDINVSGEITAADIIGEVNYVFRAGLSPEPCEAAGDVDCSGHVTSSDIISLVNHVFKSGPDPCDVCQLIWDGQWACP